VGHDVLLDVLGLQARTRHQEDVPVKQAAAMVAEAKARGPALTGPDGLLKLFTKNVRGTAPNEEMTEHLGHEKNQADPDRGSNNVRNGTRPKPWSRTPPAKYGSRCRGIGKARSSPRS
jgi:hypothetical protein